ncbi:MAG: apolipoprotein N-acyltransferase [Bacteroidales bacterium]|nr:apolipoprotein N-acyltransferase [Bacteroidales bacterium]
MKKYQLLLLSLLSGLLLSIAWPANGFPGFLFIALIPLLYMEDKFPCGGKRSCRFYGLVYSFPAFLIWNLLTTWWISNATSIGAVMAVTLNSLFMAIVFNLFHLTKKILLKKRIAYIALIVYWTAFEFLHLDWDLSWSWLNFGNGFATYYKWIQWYEYTGAFGGTVWVILVNILLYEGLNNIISKAGSKKRIIHFSVLSAIVIFLPIISSFFIYNNYEEEKDPVSVVIVQPNIDPYNELYSLPPYVVMKKTLDLADEKVDKNTDFLVCPESAIQENVWERQLEKSPSLNRIKYYLRDNPNLSIIIGASTFKKFLKVDKPTVTRRFHAREKFYYDAYNTALFLDTCNNIQLYHKSKLVPGVEKMPFPQLLNPLSELAFDLGGTVGGLGRDKLRKPFTRCRDSLKVAPLICYESIYGEFCAKFVRNGAEFITIITNDGWWGDTPGHRQHLTFASLRAIELRRSIARSANTGISCFVNQRGDIQQATKYWVTAVIKQEVNINSELTFYAIYGDYIGRISMFVAALLLLISFVRRIVKDDDVLI